MTIVIIGIVVGITMFSSWGGWIEGRRVASATNQLAADLRQAHSKAINRLEDWRIEIDADTRVYRTYRIDPGTGVSTLVSTDSLPERTEFRSGMGVSAIVFQPTGEAQITGAGNVGIAADNGSPCHEVEVNTVTSRVEVFPDAC